MTSPSASSTGPTPSASVAQTTPAPTTAAPKEAKPPSTTKSSRGGSSARGGRGKKRGGAADSAASTRPAPPTTANAQAGPSTRPAPTKSERGGASSSTTGGGPPRAHPSNHPPPSTFPPRHGGPRGGPPRRPINIIFRNPRTPASFDTDPDTRATLTKELLKGGGDLHKELIKGWKASLPTAATAKARQNLLDTISYVVASYGPQFRLALFGSAAIGGDREESDMDLCIVDLNSPDGYSLPNGALKSTDQIYNPRNLANRLERAGLVGVEAIPWARTPIVKCADPISGIEIDINCNDLGGVHNTGLILSYCLLAPYTLRPLIHAVKTWAKARKLNDPSGSTGPATFSSYSLNLLCITYLLSGPHTPALHFPPRKAHVPKAATTTDDPASIALPPSRPSSPVTPDEPEPSPSNPTTPSSPSHSPSLSSASLPTPTPSTSISAGDDLEDAIDPTPKPSSPRPSSPNPASIPLPPSPAPSPSPDLQPELYKKPVPSGLPPAEPLPRSGPLLPSLQSPALLAALNIPESHILIRGPSIRHRDRRLSTSSANGTSSTFTGPLNGNTTSSTPERVETTFATVDALGEAEVARWRERNSRVDVGELLKGFFGWFGEMTGSVTPRTKGDGSDGKGEQVPGGDWRWDRDVASLLHGGRMMRRDGTEPKWPQAEYVIQDPFIHSKNCSGAILPPSPRPLAEFRRAYEILTTGGSFTTDVCTEYIQTEPPVVRRNNRLPRGKDAPHHPSNQPRPPQHPQHPPPLHPHPHPHPPPAAAPAPTAPRPTGPVGVKPWPSHTPAPAPPPAPATDKTAAAAPPAKKSKKEKAAEKEKLKKAKEDDPEAGMSAADKFFAARMRAAKPVVSAATPPPPRPKSPKSVPLPGSRPGTPRSTWLPDSRPESPL